MKKLVVLSSLIFVFACAAFNYRFYGVDTGEVSAPVLKNIKLIPGRRGDLRKTLADFKTEPEDEKPQAILVPVDEFRLMRERLIECEGR